jgi:hypothetical protein
VVLAVGLTGCSIDSIKAKNSISAISVEADIAAQLVNNYHVARPRVHCPASVPAQVGSTFVCRAVLGGQTLDVDGKVTGAKGQVVLRPANPVVVRATAQAEIGNNLGRTFGHRVAVSCSVPALLVTGAGHTFDCTAHVGSVERQVVVTVADATGVLSFRVLPYQSG